MENNSILKIRQLNAEKQQEKVATEQINMFFKNEEQRIKDFEVRKKEKYKGDITQDINSRKRQRD